MWDESVSAWESALSLYPGAVLALQSSAKGKSGLEALETFLWSTLPSNIRARSSAYLTAEEYRRGVSWKLRRGKMRPLQRYADAAAEKDVRDASEAAFRAAANGDVRGSVQSLCVLRGCGPATASAFLAAFDDSFPFMSDEVLIAANGKREYTVPVYVALVDKVREKAKSLSDVGESKRKWTSRNVEQAAFASAISGKLQVSPGPIASNAVAESVSDLQSGTRQEFSSAAAAGAEVEEEKQQQTNLGKRSRTELKQYSSPTRRSSRLRK